MHSFYDSKYIDRYMSRLESVHLSKKSTKDLYLEQLPSTFNIDYVTKTTRKVNASILDSLLSKDYTMLFVMGTLQDSLNQILKGDIYIEDSLESREIILGVNLIDKKSYFIEDDIDIIDEYIMSEHNAVIVLNYKCYDFESNNSYIHKDFAGNLLIYCDRTYSNSKVLLDQICKKEVYYRYMKYEQMMVLIIKVGLNRYFLLPMTTIAAYEADEDIRNSYDNMLMPCNEEFLEFDDHIITNEKMQEKFDIVINSLFFTKFS